MKKAIPKTIPLLARGATPGAAVASSLLSPLALGASGDLDPSFADVGRLALPDLSGPLWSIEPQDDEAVFAGGLLCTGWYCYYEYSAVLGRLSGRDRSIWVSLPPSWTAPKSWMSYCSPMAKQSEWVAR